MSQFLSLGCHQTLHPPVSSRRRRSSVVKSQSELQEQEAGDTSAFRCMKTQILELWN